MDRLEFGNYEELVENISDTFNSIEDEYDDISVIAKYDEVKEIIRDLLFIGYDIASIDLHREEFENYYDEYILSLNHNGIWCEKFKRDYGYFEDESNIIYIMDNCSSAVIPYCKSQNIYEVSIGECADEELEEEYKPEHEYIVNGKVVDKETFDDYVSQFAPELVYDEDNDVEDDTYSGYSTTITVNLDTSEVNRIIEDINRNMQASINNMLNMSRLFPTYSPQPLRLFW